jgi:hypothetical protein
MRKSENSTMSLKFFVTEPDSAEEFDKLAGSLGACVSDANNNVKYRSTYPGIRAALCEALEVYTGEPRRSKEKKNSKGEIVAVNGVAQSAPSETEKAYYDRLLAGRYDVASERAPLTEGEAQNILSELAKSQADLFIVSPAATERSKKMPKDITSNADSIMAYVESGTTTIERVFDNIAADLGVDVDQLGDPSYDTLCSALVSVKDKQARDAAAKFVS